MSAVILSAVALGAVACGDSGDDNAGASNRQSNSQTTQGSNQSSNQSNSQSSSGSGSLSQSSFSTDEGDVRLFAGTGEATLDVDVDVDSRLLWSNDATRPFTLSGVDGPPIDSREGEGAVALTAGHYRLKVRGKVWTVVIRPN